MSEEALRQRLRDVEVPSDLVERILPVVLATRRWYSPTRLWPWGVAAAILVFAWAAWPRAGRLIYDMVQNAAAIFTAPIS